MTGMTPARVKAYAKLLVTTGVNLTDGQELLVEAQLDHAPLARAIAEEAYAHGARYVDVSYADSGAHRALVADGPDEVLGWTPPWMVQRLERGIEIGAGAIGILGASGGDAAETVDEARLARARFVAFDQTWMRGLLERRLAWTIGTFPTEAWARDAFGEPDLDRLWDAFAHALRLDEDEPAVAWEERLQQLDDRANALTERRFAALRYRGPGTDLEVGLIGGARWLAGRDRTSGGQQHAPNLPTEEVYTTPHRLRAAGTVASTRPFVLHGTPVEGLQLRFEDGEIVEARARRGEEAVRTELETVDGARHLGEVALVDAGSRVAAAGIDFHNALFDENATSHLAWGGGIPWVVDDLPPDEHLARGVNVSGTHVDFMIGGPGVEIDGVESGGAEVALLRDGVWQLPH